MEVCRWMLLMSFPLLQTHLGYIVSESPAVPKQVKQPRVDKEEIIRKLEVHKHTYTHTFCFVEILW